MDWSAAHREAMVAAFDAHEQLGLDTFGRVDVFDAMVGDGLRLVFRRLKGSAALYLPAVSGGPAGAIINAQHPLALHATALRTSTGTMCLVTASRSTTTRSRAASAPLCRRRRSSPRRSQRGFWCHPKPHRPHASGSA